MPLFDRDRGERDRKRGERQKRNDMQQVVLPARDWLLRELHSCGMRPNHSAIGWALYPFLKIYSFGKNESNKNIEYCQPHP